MFALDIKKDKKNTFFWSNICYDPIKSSFMVYKKFLQYKQKLEGLLGIRNMR